jgi:hypothetical protein
VLYFDAFSRLWSLKDWAAMSEIPMSLLSRVRSGAATPIAAAAALLALLATAGCTLSMDGMVPGPTQDLSGPGSGEILTFDLRDRAGIPVEVEGRALDRMLVAHEDPVLMVNREIVGELGLSAVMFGMGTATAQDGDHRVTGEVRRARYRIAPAEEDQIWVVDWERDVHPDYDGTISFGAIPASRFRLLLNDPPAAGVHQVWISMVLEGKSDALEAARDYDQLEFRHDLALYQQPVTATRKAVFYMARRGRLDPVSEVETFERLFENALPHVRFEVRAPLSFGGLPIGQVTGEVAPDYDPDTPSPDSEIDVIVVHTDRKRAVDAPTLYLGRSFFEACSEILVDRDALETNRRRIEVLCRANAIAQGASWLAQAGSQDEP